MSSEERRKGRAIGFFASLLIHLSAAAIAISLSGQAYEASAPAAPESVPESAVPVVSNARIPPPGHRAAVPGAPMEGSWSDRNILSLFRPIQKLAKGDRPTTEAWLNHLWQSTWFALAVGLLTIVFRRNQARVRYWLWFSASVKFFIPFSLLMTLGGKLPGASSLQTFAVPAAVFKLTQVSRPIFEGGSSGTPFVPLPPGPVGWVGIAILGLWAFGATAVVLLRFRMWRRIRRAVQMSTPVDVPRVELPTGVQAREAQGPLEPGVVGFWRPIILLPAGIEQHLTSAQFDAVLSHEICHITRRDNLTSACHMLVETIFWFHPLVWWIGARLVDERERACDEHVLGGVVEPRTYAQGILNVCKRYVDAQLPCVSGVTGSTLRKRIEAIMSNQRGEALGVWRKILLVTAGIATLAAPIATGALNLPVLRAHQQAAVSVGPAVEVASITPNRSGDRSWRLDSQSAGRITGINVPAAALIRFAYDRPAFRVSGGPNWLDADRFDVDVKATGDLPTTQTRLMLRRLLEERLKLAAHTETRALSIYALTMASNDGRMGPRLRRAVGDCTLADQPSLDTAVGLLPSSDSRPCGHFGFAPGTDFPSGRGGFGFRGLTMAALAKTLVAVVRRDVTDQTGLAGYFDGEFDFVAELPPPPPPPGMPNPFARGFASIFTVLPEQLGLMLDSRQGPVEVLVIDRVEHPQEN